MASNKPKQHPLWGPESSWRPPALGDLPSWSDAKRIGVDCETKDPNLKELGPGCRREDSYITGVSFALEDGPAHYLSLRHEGGDNMENVEQALLYLREQAAAFRGLVVGANLQYDLDWLSQDGIVFSEAAGLRDIMVADPLINELHRSYSLQAIAERHGMAGKETSKLVEAARYYNVDPKGGMWRLPARFVGEYATEDARLPLQIMRRQERLLAEQELEEVFDLECQVQPVLLRMRQRGVRVDLEKLRRIEDWSLKEESEALQQIKRLTGVEIAVGDVWKSGAVAPALTSVGVKVPTTMGRGSTPTPSIDKELLTSIDHPVARAITWARKTNKLRTTFAQSVRTHEVNGRIHCSYNQLRKTSDKGETRGAAYGRLSSENPNMQQQPSRDEFASMWRGIYLPEEGMIWGSLDYSQQEPRMLVHYAELCGLEGASEAAERYREDPDTDYHQMVADMTGVSRKASKEIGLGKIYGMGGAKLCRKLGLPTRWAVFQDGWGQEPAYFEGEKDARAYSGVHGGRAFEVAGEEGQQLVQQFDHRLPYVKTLARMFRKKADRVGYIRTISGRRCRFPVRDQSYDWTHKALNRGIQGSSADQTKKALVQVDAAGHFMQLQVHDELTGSFPSREAAQEAAKIMEECYKLRVPFKVDVETGPSWGEAS